MNHPELAAAIKQQLASSYPNISVEAKPCEGDPSRPAIYFLAQEFADLYPEQRYHHLIHTISDDFYQQRSTNSVRFELAPGERPDDLRYPDEELVNDISSDVLDVLTGVRFFDALDGLVAPMDETDEGIPCQGDFQLAKRILQEKGFGQRGDVDEVFDICHVLMSEGAYCDCEILYNVAEGSRLNARYWRMRAEGEANQEIHRTE